MQHKRLWIIQWGMNAKPMCCSRHNFSSYINVWWTLWQERHGCLLVVSHVSITGKHDIMIIKTLLIWNDWIEKQNYLQLPNTTSSSMTYVPCHHDCMRALWKLITHWSPIILLSSLWHWTCERCVNKLVFSMKVPNLMEVTELDSLTLKDMQAIS